MKDCERCGGKGILAIRSGDDDQQCPICHGTGIFTPAPVVVQMGSYKATVSKRGDWYHLALMFIDTPEDLANSFCSDYHKVIALGRALVLACRTDQPHKYIGYDWAVGENTFTGWLTFRERKLPILPNIVSQAGGLELGTALIQLGQMLRARRELALWLGQPIIDAKVG